MTAVLSSPDCGCGINDELIAVLRDIAAATARFETDEHGFRVCVESKDDVRKRLALSALAKIGAI